MATGEMGGQGTGSEGPDLAGVCRGAWGRQDGSLRARNTGLSNGNRKTGEKCRSDGFCALCQPGPESRGPRAASALTILSPPLLFYILFIYS